MRYKPTNTVNGVVVSRLQGEPSAELMLVTSDGKSQVLSLSLLMLAKIVEQGAMALARAATELPIPPRKHEHAKTLEKIASCESHHPSDVVALARAALKDTPPVTRGDDEIMKDVCKILKDDDNGGTFVENTVQRNQEYVDVANRTQAALDTPSWLRRAAPRVTLSK